MQLEKGSRRLQLKNAMRAKFDRILVPLAGVMLDESQAGLVTFDAFFGNTMFHEVAHGLGIKNTVTGRGTVREALLDHASAVEEGKADVLGLYMVERLIDSGDVSVHVSSVHPLEQAAEAHAAIETGRTRGKRVLRVREG